MSQYGWEEAPLEVAEQVGRFTDATLDVLGDIVVGIYLHGSLSTGAFNPVRSDIDFLVVTGRAMVATEKTAFAEQMLEISADPAPLEVSVLVRSELNPFEHPTPFDFHYSENWREKFRAHLMCGDGDLFGEDPRDRDLAGHLMMARERGVVLYGAPVKDALPPVAHEYYWASVLEDFEWGRKRRHEYPVYVVLNACRIYHYREEGSVVSKDEGGMWALERTPVEHRPVIKGALDAYRGEANDGGLNPEDVDRLLEWIEPRIKNPESVR